MLKVEEFWDCHWVFQATSGRKRKRDLVLGIMELSEAVNLAGHLPEDLQATLKPLFRYRNEMFHSGFEWPAKDCENFAKQIADEGWDGLFSSATRNDVPFIFYMKDDLIKRSFDLIHRLLNSLGSYCHEKLRDG
jgi:hypothetical protein